MKWEWKLSQYWTSILLSINVSGDVRGRQPGQPPGGRADERAGLRAGAAPTRGGAAATPPAGARLPHPRPLSLGLPSPHHPDQSGALGTSSLKRKKIYSIYAKFTTAISADDKKAFRWYYIIQVFLSMESCFQYMQSGYFTPFPIRIMLCAMIQLWDITL